MVIYESERSRNISNNIFQELNNKKLQLKQSGKEVFDFSIGTPDFLPSQHIIKALRNGCNNIFNFKYALHDMPELIDAVKNHYSKRFGVELKSEQIASAQGSQDIISHIALSLCDTEDLILVPDPGYPSFSIAPELMGVKIYRYPLLKQNRFILNTDDIPKEIADRAKFIILCYPSNPTGSVPDRQFYKEIIAWAKKHNVIIIHDSAYIDISFVEHNSFLSYEGASEVGVELYSLSKTYNLTGARIAFILGNKEIVQSFKKIKSQIDYGMFIPIQHAAIAALTGPQHDVYAQCNLYNSRRDLLSKSMSNLGWDIPKSDGGIFAWAPIPQYFIQKGVDSSTFAIQLLERTGIMTVPGISFGEHGEGYVRFAIVHPKEVIEQAVAVLKESKFLEDLT